MKNTQENTVHTALSAVGHFFGELGCSLAKGLRKFFSNSKTIVGFAILVFFVLVAVFGPLLFPYNSDTDMANSYLMPSWEHPFGTDWLGRDVFRQVIAGTGSVLEIAFYSAVFTVVIGTVLGIVSGYLGGWVDKVIMAVTNIFLSIPSFRIYLLLTFLNGVQACAGVFFQAIGKPIKAAVTSLSKQFLFILPAMLILTRLIGVEGVLWSGPVADALAFLLAGGFSIGELRKLKEREAAK